MAMTQVCQRAIDLGPEMELRVRGADGQVERVKLAEHLTIGRSAASDMLIDDAGANLIHARVVPGIAGGLELRCVGMAKLMMEDRSVVDRLALMPGVRFWVGDTRVECTRLGAVGPAGEDTAEPKTNGNADEPDQEARPVEMPRLVICPTCYRDMTGVPSVARFCPKCGVQLPARDAAGFLIPPEESSPLYPVYHALREELGAKLADETPQVASSLIILAYANAMLNLGWRYEHGRGTMRNVEEAARCYAKAGKLAEAWGK